MKHTKPVGKKEAISKTELPYDLPDQSDSLSLEMLCTSIVAANAAVEEVLKATNGKVKQHCVNTCAILYICKLIHYLIF